MKLTLAFALAVALCLLSLAARSSILARQRAAAAVVKVTPAAASERLALDGLDGRIKSRVHRLAAAPRRAAAH